MKHTILFVNVRGFLGNMALEAPPLNERVSEDLNSEDNDLKAGIANREGPFHPAGKSGGTDAPQKFAFNGYFEGW